MKRFFLPYELCVLAKEKGFDWPSLGFYWVGNEIFHHTIKYIDHNSLDSRLSAPLYDQIIEWFDNVHNLHLDKIWYDDKLTPARWVYHINSQYAGSHRDEAIKKALKQI